MVWMDVRAEVGVLKIQRKNRNNEIASGRVGVNSESLFLLTTCWS